MSPFEMEIALKNMGYEQEYLDTLDNGQLKTLYEDTFGKEE